MAFAEVIFETGAKSVLSFEDISEVEGFVVEHDRRARAGEDGGPTGFPAERIARVLLYKEHPADLNTEGTIPVERLQELVAGMSNTGIRNAAGGSVPVNQLMEALRDELSPVYPVDQGRHESIYKAEGTEYDVAGLLGENGKGGESN